MRVLQLVAADQWTGAAATALQVADALRRAGVQCHFAYRPGRNLEQRLVGLEWCHPELVKERSLSDLRAALGRVRNLGRRFDIVHVHLPHDHLLARVAFGGSSFPAGARPTVIRSLHHPGHLRPDPFHRWLFRGTAGVGAANTAMLRAASRIPSLRDAPAVVLPVALEPRFRPGAGREKARTRLSIPQTAVVAGTIGKLDLGRGHDLFLHGLAAAPGVWGLIIGHGPRQEDLASLARRLGVVDRVAFPGYTEDGLESLYAAMDLFVFPAAGSDWAHRAIAEASGCGLPTIAADLDGVRDLVEPGVTGDVYPPADAAALAVLLRAWSGDAHRRRSAGNAAADRTWMRCDPSRLADVATRLYDAAVARSGPRLMAS